MDDDEEDGDYTQALRLIGAPFLLVVAPICGYFIGDWLDAYLDTGPYLAYFFLALGIIAGIREFYKLVKQQCENDDQAKH